MTRPDHYGNQTPWQEPARYGEGRPAAYGERRSSWHEPERYGERRPQWQQPPTYDGYQPQQYSGGDTYLASEPEASPVRTNTYAIAALVCAILGNACLSGVVLGIMGLVRSTKTRSGKAMSWSALALSVVWIVFAVAYVAPHANALVQDEDTARRVPVAAAGSIGAGCVDANKALATFEKRYLADGKADSLTKQSADMTTLARALETDASKPAGPGAPSAMHAMATDLRKFADEADHHQVPSHALIKKLTTDQTSLYEACQ